MAAANVGTGESKASWQAGAQLRVTTSLTQKEHKEVEKHWDATMIQLFALSEVLNWNVIVAKLSPAYDIESIAGTSKCFKVEDQPALISMVTEYMRNPANHAGVSATKLTVAYYEYVTKRLGKLNSQAATNHTGRLDQLERLYHENYYMPPDFLQIMEEHVRVSGHEIRAPCGQWRHWHQEKKHIPKCVQTYLFGVDDGRAGEGRIKALSESMTAIHAEKRTRPS